MLKISRFILRQKSSKRQSRFQKDILDQLKHKKGSTAQHKYGQTVGKTVVRNTSQYKMQALLLFALVVCGILYILHILGFNIRLTFFMIIREDENLNEFFGKLHSILKDTLVLYYINIVGISESKIIQVLFPLFVKILKWVKYVYRI